MEMTSKVLAFKRVTVQHRRDSFLPTIYERVAAVKPSGDEQFDLRITFADGKKPLLVNSDFYRVVIGEEQRQ
jgi:hypothetical protein